MWPSHMRRDLTFKECYYSKEDKQKVRKEKKNRYQIFYFLSHVWTINNSKVFLYKSSSSTETVV